MSIFHERLAKAIDNSSKFGGNRAKLSKALGMSPNYVSTVLSTGTNPNWDVVVKISNELGVSLGYLAGTTSQPFDIVDLADDGPITDQALRFFDRIAGSLRQAAVMRGQEPTIDDMMALWYRFGKAESGFAELLEWFDIYDAPTEDDQHLRVLRMGSHSLAARTLGKSDIRSLQYALSEVPDSDLRQRLVTAYRKAAEGDPVLTEEYLDVLAPGHAEKIRLDYLRLLLPVTRADGGTSIVSYSKALR
ncbi:MAG: helix-turn-helix domain-containing protein [Rhodobacteraceae bacterium]|nr:helix-turn-helix domain-containing protein [Paracoccaceae bacterium]